MKLSLAQFSADLRRLPKVVALKVAEAAAPELTKIAKEAFDGSQDPYGVPWEPSVITGKRVTLRKSGDLERHVVYVSIGTKIRVQLGVRYAKYQVGKRPVFPRQTAGLPPKYVQALQRTAVRVVRQELGV